MRVDYHEMVASMDKTFPDALEQRPEVVLGALGLALYEVIFIAMGFLIFSLMLL